jgi:hypothetical protein
VLSLVLDSWPSSPAEGNFVPGKGVLAEGADSELADDYR